MPALTKDITSLMETYFTPDLIAEYQRKGSQIKPLVMGPKNINAEFVKWYVRSKIEAVKKPRGEVITLTNPTHGDVTAELQPYYTRTTIQRQDEAQFNFPHIRADYARDGAEAVGRKCDDIIVTEGLGKSIASGTQSTPVGSATTETGMTLAKIQAAVEILGNNDVGMGNYACLVAPPQWQELMNIDAFASSDFVTNSVWDKGMYQSRYFNRTLFMEYTGLPLSATNVRTCYLWEKSAVGFADSVGIRYYIDFDGKRDENDIVAYVDAAATLIQEKGVVPIYCDETLATAYANL